MEKITEKKADAMLAEKVMGWVCNEVHFANQNHPWWTKDGVLVTTIKAWNPTTDERHAMQCLREWRKTPGRSAIIDFTNLADYNISLMLKHREFDPYKADYYHSDDNLCHAITIALLEAETGIKYEILG